MSHDVFISYAASENGPAAQVLCDTLERNGIPCWIAPRDILPGIEYGEALADAIPASHALVLLLSRGANDSPFVHREVERAATHKLPILTVRLEDVQPARKLELFISSLHWFDAFSRPAEEYLPDLVNKVRLLLLHQEPGAGAPVAARIPTIETPAVSLRVALLYKRRTQPDERLLALLESHLNTAGHRVFIDRHMTIGVEWAKQIAEEIRGADAVVTLLSAASVNSEMLAYEVEVAYQAAQENNGKPRLFPVRIHFEGPLPPELASKLDPLHYFLWDSPEDDTRLLTEVLEGITTPPRVPPTRRGTLEMVGGAVPLDSKFYIVRPVDDEFHAAISRGDATVLLKGARQMGKTSLLARGLKAAREAGVRIVLTDFQKLGTEDLRSLESFYLAIGEILADQLDLDKGPREVWKPGRSPNSNFERYIRREVLGKNGERHLLWAMDEVDRLFNCGYGGDVFALFRTWHNERALDPNGPWSRLTLAISYATEAHLFITDPNQSPFNVGTRLSLSDFTLDQVADLNRRYGSPLRDGADLTRFYRLLGGQPYLTRRGLNDFVSLDMTLEEFAAKAALDDGPFGDHLRRILVLLARDVGLCDAVRHVLRDEPCPDSETFYRLRSAGILSGHTREEAHPRCEIYALYLRRQLG